MEIGRWSRVEELFHQAADLPAAERCAFLDRVCRDDGELRREVESLLAADTQDELLLAVVRQAVDQLPTAADEGSELIGTRIGRYLITGLIGKGGMGAVYRAVRTDDFHMQVAIKLLKRGTETELALNRFRSERQILANLQHPHIARLLDGGATDTGLPYLVMEYVDGTSLLEYAAPLAIRQRLELFRSICSAVEYAHQHRIVHRDIKPGNILVTREGTPKLLDFGIAKLLAATEDTGNATLTMAGVRVMTPDYASPEQVRGEPVTPATDIYSLGAVLYELLTGQRAHHVETHSPSEIEKAICTHEPKRPSTVVKHLDRDLDNIVMKALRKEAERRYGSAQELADDLDRFLHDLPVKARKENLFYRGRKFLKRKRGLIIAVGLTAFIVLTLVAGVIWILTLHSGIPQAVDSMAVLPFENVQKDPEIEYLADGFSESLTTTLSRIPDLRVIARTTVLRYKDQVWDLQKIAKQLKVRTIVTGSFSKTDGGIQLKTELVDGSSGAKIWGQQYDGDVNEMLHIQTDVLQKVSQHLKIDVAKETKQQLDQHNTRDPEAYRLYLKGRYAVNRNVPADLKRSIEYFSQAIRTDPNYALAYSGLADAYSSLSGQYLKPAEAMARAKAAVSRALELDPALAECHISRGVILGYYDFQWVSSEKEFKRALELTPNHASAHLWRGWILTMTGQFDEGIKEARLAHELDPLSPYIETGLGQIYCFARKYELGIKQLHDVVDLNSDFVNAHIWLGVAYLYTREYARAISELEQATRLDPGLPQPYGYLTYAFARTGDKMGAARMLDKLMALKSSGYVSDYLFAVVSIGQKANDAGIHYLESAYTARDDMLGWLKVDSLLDPLRSDPRFKLLMRQVGFGSGAHR